MENQFTLVCGTCGPIGGEPSREAMRQHIETKHAKATAGAPPPSSSQDELCVLAGVTHARSYPGSANLLCEVKALHGHRDLPWALVTCPKCLSRRSAVSPTDYRNSISTKEMETMFNGHMHEFSGLDDRCWVPGCPATQGSAAQAPAAEDQPRLSQRATEKNVAVLDKQIYEANQRIAKLERRVMLLEVGGAEIPIADRIAKLEQQLGRVTRVRVDLAPPTETTHDGHAHSYGDSGRCIHIGCASIATDTYTPTNLPDQAFKALLVGHRRGDEMLVDTLKRIIQSATDTERALRDAVQQLGEARAADPMGITQIVVKKPDGEALAVYRGHTQKWKRDCLSSHGVIFSLEFVVDPR